MSKVDVRVLIIISMAFCISVSSASAVVLTGTSTAVEVETGVWKYTIDVQWDFSDEIQNGISHWEVDLNNTLLCPLALKDEFGEDTGNIWFEDVHPTYVVDLVEYPFLTGVDGTSTPDDREPGTDDVLWFGLTDIPQGDGNGVKYEQPLLYDPLNPAPLGLTEPGVSGEGTFWFYSIFGPGPIEMVDISAKADNFPVTGTLTGDLPYCIPEPTSMCLLGLGVLGLLRKRRA